MTHVTKRIEIIRARIQQAAKDCGRDATDIRLIAVSKTRSAAEIRPVLAAGLLELGENYLQDALPKIEELQPEKPQWHFIGPVQSNKTRDLAAHFSWVQSIDRLKIARRLSEQRGAWAPALNVCVQVNIDHEPQKAGVAPEEVAELCQAITTLPRLKLRGLMIIPAASDDPKCQLRSFTAARSLFDELCANGLPLDTLSMGMSRDLEAAIAAGSSMVRIGTDIFGPRS